MVHQLLQARMDFWTYIFPHQIKFDPCTYWRPLKMKMWILIGGFQPKILSSLHGNPYKSGVVSRKNCEPQFVWVKRGCQLDCLRSEFCLVINISHSDGRVKIHHPLSIIVFVMDSRIAQPRVLSLRLLSQ